MIFSIVFVLLEYWTEAEVADWLTNNYPRYTPLLASYRGIDMAMLTEKQAAVVLQSIGKVHGYVLFNALQALPRNKGI